MKNESELIEHLKQVLPELKFVKHDDIDIPEGAYILTCTKLDELEGWQIVSFIKYGIDLTSNEEENNTKNIINTIKQYETQHIAQIVNADCVNISKNIIYLIFTIKYHV